MEQKKPFLSANMRNKPPSAAEALADEVVALRQEVQVLRETMDEIKECFEWAIHNGQAIPVPVRTESPPADEPVTDPRTPLGGKTKQDSLF